MIYGIGTDILTIKRIEQLFKKYGEALPRRILSRIEELEFTTNFPNAKNDEAAILFLAKRFAAKEAFSKAVGTGIREPVSLSQISIGHNDLGKPEFLLEAALQNWLTEQGIGKVHLSLSDESESVVAMVVVETL